MGLRFNLQYANWIAHIVDERMAVPELYDEFHERFALESFVSSLDDDFYSSPKGKQNFRRALTHARKLLDGDRPSRAVIDILRKYLGNRPWTALLVPSGDDSEVDRLLCSPKFLKQLVEIRPDDPGLILQVKEPEKGVFPLVDVFPAFRTALAAATEWPGILLWTPHGDSVFLPLSGGSVKTATHQGRWLFSHISTTVGLDLELLKEQYYREFAEALSPPTRVTILHISDIHLGCREASLRLRRVEDILASLIDDLGDSQEAVIPLVSGDLMDSPDEDNLDRVRTFLGTLQRLGTEEPIVLLGNHDVRKDGYLAENLKMAMQIDRNSGAVRWFDQFRLAIACFDSVRGGHLARGYIGERQLLDMGSTLDSRCRDESDYMVIAALHHHPIPVKVPEWYLCSFYERVLSGSFEATEELKDASDFVAFVEQRQLAAVLHGHKHIPRIDPTPAGIPIIGCGSTVSKVKTRDKRPFMSFNVLTINTSNRKLSARLLAERIPGGGLTEYKSHEIVWSPQPARTYRPTPPAAVGI